MRWQQALLGALAFGVVTAKTVTTPIKLGEETYKELTTSARNHSAAILLTALDPRFGCELCRVFKPDWELLAKSWTQGEKDTETSLVFGTLDFADGRQTFISLGLQTAPVLMLFPPTTGPFAVNSPKSLRYDFSSGDPRAEQIYSWLTQNLPGRPHPTFRRPINYVRWLVTIVSVLGTAGVLFIGKGLFLPILTNRNIWSIISVGGILVFTSGHMFNQIRKVPYLTADKNGGVTYITPGFQNQLGVETQIIGAVYGLMAFATIQLACRAPRAANPGLQQVTVILWSGVVFLVHGILLSVFRIKNGGYPFRLPPFL